MSSLQRLALGVLLVVGVACGDAGVRRYDDNVERLGATFIARQACSCLFVLGHDEEFCHQYSRLNPFVHTLHVNREERTVQAAVFLFWVGRAHFDEEPFGCLAD